MKRKIRFFRQHSLETCGISCILMVLDYYGRVQYPTGKQEEKLYGIYRCRAFKGTLAASIAKCLTWNGLETEIYHSGRQFLENRDDYYPDDLYRKILDEYTVTIDSIKDKTTVKTGCAITPDWYRSQLDQGKLVIVQCIVPGNADGMHEEVLHWILLYGYENREFLACDPLSSKICLSEPELEKYTKTPVGSICITVSEPPKRR